MSSLDAKAKTQPRMPVEAGDDPAPVTISAGARFASYMGANLISVSLDTWVFLILVHLLGLPTLSSMLGYSCGIVVNYGLSKRFVFRHLVIAKSESRLFVEFLGTGVLGLLLTASVTAVGVHEIGLAPGAAKGLAVLTCFVVLYFVRCMIFMSKASS